MYKMSVEWKSTMQLSMIYLQFNYQVQYSTTILFYYNVDKKQSILVS